MEAIQDTKLDTVMSLVGRMPNLTVKKFSNRVMAKEFILSSVRDSRGYRAVTKSIIEIVGSVVFYPHLKLIGNYVVVLTVTMYMDVARGCLREENTLVIFEQSERG